MRRHEGEKSKRYDGKRENTSRGGEQRKESAEVVEWGCGGLISQVQKDMTDWILLACIFSKSIQCEEGLLSRVAFIDRHIKYG